MTENRATLEVPEPFVELFQPSKQWRHLVYYGGRASGKSRQAGMSILVKGVAQPVRVLCVRELQGSMADSVHQLLADLISQYEFLNTWNVQKDVIFNTKTGSKITFKGLHNNTQAIKSTEGVDIVWAEEAQSISAASIRTLIPTIRKEGSYFIWTFNRQTDCDPVWERIVLQKDERTYIRKVNSDEIEELLSPEIIYEREKMKENNPEMYAHDWLGEPLTAKTGSVFGKQLARAQIEDRITSVPYDAMGGVYTAWDLGVGDSTVIWFFQIMGKEIHFIDYYESSGEDLSHYIAILREKGYNYATHYLPHDARQRELQTGMTRVEFFERNGIRNVEVLRPTNFSIGNDDINLIARPKMTRCWFDAEKCERGLECLRAYHYEFDEKNNLLKAKPEHDWSSHASSAFIYALIAETAAETRASAPIIKIRKPRNGDINKILF